MNQQRKLSVCSRVLERNYIHSSSAIKYKDQALYLIIYTFSHWHYRGKHSTCDCTIFILKPWFRVTFQMKILHTKTSKTHDLASYIIQNWATSGQHGLISIVGKLYSVWKKMPETMDCFEAVSMYFLYCHYLFEVDQKPWLIRFCPRVPRLVRI